MLEKGNKTSVKTAPYVPCKQQYSQSGGLSDYQLDFGRIFPIKTDYRICSKSITNLYTFLNIFPN